MAVTQVVVAKNHPKGCPIFLHVSESLIGGAAIRLWEKVMSLNISHFLRLRKYKFSEDYHSHL